MAAMRDTIMGTDDAISIYKFVGAERENDFKKRKRSQKEREYGKMRSDTMTGESRLLHFLVADFFVQGLL